MTISKDKMAELIAKARANAEAKKLQVPVTYEYLGKEITKPEFEELAEEVITDLVVEDVGYTTATGKVVTLNDEQLRFVNWIKAGESVVLIGKAGTGKTTAAGVGMTELIKAGTIKPMSGCSKYLQAGLPGVVIVSFTNKAVNNIRKQMPADLQHHTITLHKLLEFKPVKYEIIDPETGDYKITMRFEPSRNAFNPLPSDLKLVVIEESSMVSVELHQLMVDAMPHQYQTIFLGDIRQLPPVMGTAILGFKMLELLVIELTEVYRQALLSPILRMALSIDSGESVKFNGDSKIKDANDKWTWPVLAKWNESSEHGSLKIHPWQKSLTADLALLTAVKFMTTLESTGHEHYNPEVDIILCPFNKAFGTIELNKGIAQHLGAKRVAIVHEVIAGYNKHYLAVGDRVLYNKEDAFITNIARNSEYMGKRPQAASKNLNRWGHIDESIHKPEAKDFDLTAEDDAAFDLQAIENFLESSAAEIEERVTAASHVVTIRYADDKESAMELELDKALEINNLLGGYAITVHKAQGSEYDKVFLLLHQSHNVMLSRELLYTACTRAAKHLYIICEPNAITKGISSQRIKGNTLAEKAEFFKGKMDSYIEKTKQDYEELDRIRKLKISVWQAVQKAISSLNACYPNKEQVTIKEITYVDTGSTAGTAYFGSGIININPVYLQMNTEEMLAKTVPHEVAHVFAYHWFCDTGHGTAWKQLCIEAGGTGDMYHDYGSGIKTRNQFKSTQQKAKIFKLPAAIEHEALLSRLEEQIKARPPFVMTPEESAEAEANFKKFEEELLDMDPDEV